jgi:transcriptional regulator with GAF, ATPase, and Fis domain
MEIDALQYRHSEGPCLDALTHRLIFCADDLSNDLRWPNFAPLATSAGIRSVLALPLSMESQQGALSLCAHCPDAFGVVGRAKATVLASLASLTLSLAHSYEDEERRAAAYRSVTTGVELLGKAVGHVPIGREPWPSP